MLYNIKDLYGHSLAALDGTIGHIRDFYVDDRHWNVRYLVVDTGTWLPGRRVLIAPRALGVFDTDLKQLQVHLSRDRIEHAPSIETHRPVSRQFEADYHSYYGWPPYWADDLTGVSSGLFIDEAMRQADQAQEKRSRNDRHLHSTKEIKGYELHATDGLAGQVSGFVVDDQGWKISNFVVEPQSWHWGRALHVNSSHIVRIDYDKSRLFANLSLDEIGGKTMSPTKEKTS